MYVKYIYVCIFLYIHTWIDCINYLHFYAYKKNQKINNNRVSVKINKILPYLHENRRIISSFSWCVCKIYHVYEISKPSKLESKQ